jgi:hypothetical protein
MHPWVTMNVHHFRMAQCDQCEKIGLIGSVVDGINLLLGTLMIELMLVY